MFSDRNKLDKVAKFDLKSKDHEIDLFVYNKSLWEVRYSFNEALEKVQYKCTKNTLYRLDESQIPINSYKILKPEIEYKRCNKAPVTLGFVAVEENKKSKYKTYNARIIIKRINSEYSSYYDLKYISERYYNLESDSRYSKTPENIIAHYFIWPERLEEYYNKTQKYICKKLKNIPAFKNKKIIANNNFPEDWKNISLCFNIRKMFKENLDIDIYYNMFEKTFAIKVSYNDFGPCWENIKYASQIDNALTQVFCKMQLGDILLKKMAVNYS
jgi:hypothetical protein